MIKKEIKKEGYLSVAELAKELGISRIAVFKRIKKGQIPAERVGRAFVISAEVANDILNKKTDEILTADKKEEIEKAVHKVVEEYGETLKLLGKE